MKKSNFEVKSNIQLTDDVYEIKLYGDTGEIKKPGQFVEVEIEELFLRRPISVCDINGNNLTLIYKVVGIGTDKLSTLQKGTTLNVLTGLGNGYDLSKSGDKPMLIGGGVGLPPMYFLAKELISKGKNPVIVMGFNTKSELFYKEEFEKLGAEVLVSTMDGSEGTKGFVTDAITQNKVEYSFTYACGPKPMLKAVYDTCTSDGQFSFEERMGCGFGACMGCSIKTKRGSKRVCKDGPIFDKEDIIW